MTNPYNGGPNRDGSKSISPEGKTGVLTTGVLFFVLQTIAQGLSGIDTSNWGGWWVPLANGAIAAAVGWIAAWLKRNR